MEIQERIIREAGILFGKYGIRGITMDTLAEDMGISKRTIYENFKDKDTLLLEVMLFYKKLELIETNKIFDKAENVVEALYLILQRMINTMKQINPIFFQDLKKYHTQIFQKMELKGDIRDHSVTRRILQEGVKQKIFTDSFNIEIVNQTLHELFNLFSPDSRLTSSGFHRAELFHNCLLPYLLGISTEKGRELLLAQEELS